MLPRSGGTLRNASLWLFSGEGLTGVCLSNVSKELKGDKEVTIETVVGPFSCLLVVLSFAVHARKPDEWPDPCRSEQLPAESPAENFRQVYLVTTEPLLRNKSTPCTEHTVNHTMQTMIIILTMFGHMYDTCVFFPQLDQIRCR